MAVERVEDPADLVLSGARVCSVFMRVWLELDVAVKDSHVVGLGSYEGLERHDLGGAYLVPGFIDSHMHLESSKLMFDQFARAVLHTAPRPSSRTPTRSPTCWGRTAPTGSSTSATASRSTST